MPGENGALADQRRSPHFVSRKLHSLSGVLPVGLFLCMHLATNASILGGPQVFQDNVDRIHSLHPYLIPVEIVGIFLPLAFHAALGVRIWLTGVSNTSRYSYFANIRYSLQRLTSVIVLFFIVFHLWHMHWTGKPFGGGAFDPESPMASYTAGVAIQHARWYAPVYAIGIAAACFHFANGLWTFLIAWGITIGVNAQRKAGYLCASIGVGVCVLGWAALWTFRNTPPEQFWLPVRSVVVEANRHG